MKSAPLSCRECHREIFAKWAQSDHAMANRKLDSTLDEEAFAPDRILPQGSFISRFRKGEEGYEILARGADGKGHAYRPVMALGRFPLRQYLIPFPGGRFQATEAAWDPEKKEWFDVFGEEERLPTDWGFWANRGMNWNSRCAFCHTTFFKKGYDLEEDRYRSTWTAQGINCFQCHGLMEKHAEAVKNPAYRAKKPTPSHAMDTCASCHSRREDLTGNFLAGEPFDDHFRLALPARVGLYFSDGQIKEEVYVYGSFRLSKMGNAGVTCLDCHDPHSGKLKLPVSDNALCLSCHGSSRKLKAPFIDPVEHSRHPPGSAGFLCVECHMPVTVYMQRDPRRDHGFPIPDPVLTEELGIPNACNRCHEDKPAAWAAEWTKRWYGERMRRPERERTRLLAKAYKGNPEILAALLGQFEKERLPTWKATLLSLAAPFAGAPEVKETSRRSLADPNPLVRSAAIRNLAEFPGEQPRLRELLKDPSRLVRLDASWVLQGEMGRNSLLYKELTRSLDFNADQPAGASRRAQFFAFQNRFEEAETEFEKSIAWDSLVPEFYSNYAIFLNARGKYAEALQNLREARKLDPANPSYPFMTALIYADLGKDEQTESLLRETLAMDPDFTRAWYNLSLFYAGREELDKALEAIREAELREPENPLHPYVEGTLYLRVGKTVEARKATSKALSLDPDYPPALRMMKTLDKGTP